MFTLSSGRLQQATYSGMQKKSTKTSGFYKKKYSLIYWILFGCLFFRHIFGHSFKRSFGRSFGRSLGHSFGRSFGRSFGLSFGCSFGHSFGHSLECSFDTFFDTFLMLFLDAFLKTSYAHHCIKQDFTQSNRSWTDKAFVIIVSCINPKYAHEFSYKLVSSSMISNKSTDF